MRASDRKQHGAVFADLLDVDTRRRIQGGRRQPLARACGLHKLRNSRILDATAGLGRDGIVLAAVGAGVSLFERSPVIAALLGDAIQRALQDETMAQWLSERVSFACQDSAEFMRSERGSAPELRHEVVYLDPMFPHRDKTALARKEMRVLRALAGDDDDAAELLAAALEYATRRVVVKRPPWASPIGNVAPNHQVSGNLARYDVYFTTAGQVTEV